MKKSIVIVDDHLLLAKALKTVISNFEGFEVIYDCENGRDLQLKMSENKIPDIVLLDISMPIMNGFQTAKWLSDTHPEVLTMALSMDGDEESLVKMIQNGAKGYLLKNAHPTELEKGLIELVTNGSYYPQWASKMLFSKIGEKEPEEEKIKLSDREKEFLRYTITEMSYKEIADKMFCSPRTIDSYRDNLFSKLEIKTRVGLAVYAMKHGLV